MKLPMAAALSVCTLFAGQSALAQCQQSASACSGEPTVTAGAMEASAGTIVEVAVAAGSFTTLVAAVKAAGLAETLSGSTQFTVFAPTDEAFEALPPGTVDTLLKPENRELLKAILLYHVVPGELMAADVVKRTGVSTAGGQQIDIEVSDKGVTVDGARVIQTNVDASNGVIHVIDRVIMPATEDIVGTAVEAGAFTTLAAALKAAGLVEALQGKGPFTVFAPTDEAFAALPAGTVETLLRPENRSRLADILKYHVVPGRVYARDAAAAQTATTLQGTDVRISIKNGRLTVDGATVIASDIEATNGVIHVIDAVILPD